MWPSLVTHPGLIIGTFKNSRFPPYFAALQIWPSLHLLLH